MLKFDLSHDKLFLILQPIWIMPWHIPMHEMWMYEFNVKLSFLCYFGDNAWKCAGPTKKTKNNPEAQKSWKICVFVFF
jgi:hypothetical protein